MNIDTDKIEENTYSKYLLDLESYYKLKKKYTIQKNSYVNKLLNTTVSSDVRQKLFSKYKPKCVNCGKEGGTIFKESNKMLKAVCGSTLSPCDLNIEIVKLNSIYLDKEIEKINKKIKNTKELIITTKLDYIFKYIDEERIVEIFNELKTSLSKSQDEYISLIKLYNSIVNNSENIPELESKVAEYIQLLNQINEYTKIYETTDDKEYLRNTAELYIEKLIPLNENILKLKYKHNNVEKDDDNIFTIIQDKYNINDLEIILKPNK